jgi:hypothetical protein
MKRIRMCGLSCASCAILFASLARAAGLDTQRINGYQAKTLLGDGTGVIVGIVDSGIDKNHPALTGTVSGGLSRLVAEANFVTSEPSNTGDDVFGHGTAVAGQILSRDATFGGVATDARYINARVLDSGNSFSTDSWVVNGAGFAVANGASLLNMSLGYFNADTSGNSKLSAMADYMAFGLRLPMTISAGNAGNNANHLPQGPGDAFNVFSVASSSKASNWSRIVSSSSYGPTTDLRDKPEISAPGDQIVTAQQHTSGFSTWSGTSFAAPNTAGVLAAALDYGFSHGISVDPLVLKASLLNTAEKILDRNGASWSPNAASTVGGVYIVTSPLNASAGAGQVDGLQFATQYMSGQYAPGNVSAVGWDLDNVGASVLDYHLGQLATGSTLRTTLNWFRHVGWTDAGGNGIIDSADSFPVVATLANLDLFVYRDNQLIAESVSTRDNVEELYLTNILAGDYDIHVSRISGTGNSEQFGLAWSSIAVPEPGILLLAASAGVLVLGTARRDRARQLG